MPAPAGARHGGIDGCAVCDVLGHQNIPQTLARDRQGLGEGVADDGVLIDVGDPVDGRTLKDDLAVRFVRDDIDGVTVSLASASEDGCQFFQCFPGIDNTGGVVGVVEDHGLGVGGDGLLQRIKIDLETLDFRGDNDGFAAVALHKHLILREIGGKEDILIAGTAQTAEHTAQRRGGAAGDEELIGGVSGAEAAVEAVGKALTHQTSMVLADVMFVLKI